MLNKNYKVCRDLNELAAYINNPDAVAFDFETAPLDGYRDDSKASLDAHRSDIVGISFSVRAGSAVYIPLRHRVGRNFTEQDKLWDYLRELFTSERIVKIAHNLSFEAMFLYAKGLVIKEPCYDTFAAVQMTIKKGCQFMTLSDCGLKTLFPHMTHFADVTAGRFFDELDPDDDATVEYACADSDYTLRLYHACNDWFNNYLPKHRLIVEEIESSTAVYCGMMKYNGAPFDKDLIRQELENLEKRKAALKDKISVFTGGVDIGESATSKAFKEYLFDSLKLPETDKTDKGKSKLDETVFTDLIVYCDKNDKPDIKQFLLDVSEFKRVSKLKKYLVGLQKAINPVTGCIHPNMMPLGTETGRFSSSNPNLQNMPRSGKGDTDVRALLEAPEGCKILSADFSQIELRVGAYLCRDEKMIETYQNNGDIHAQTSEVIFGKEDACESKHSSEHRIIAKNCNFGIFYGLFPNGLLRTLKYKAGLPDATIEQSNKIIESIKKGYPKLVEWQNTTKINARRRKLTETRSGRRRYLPDIDSDDFKLRGREERKALNTPIQGTAADILKMSMVRIVEQIADKPWLKPILQVHDELVFIVPDEHIDEAAEFVRICMEQQPYPDFDVPLKVDIETGQNYGALKEYKRGDSDNQNTYKPCV